MIARKGLNTVLYALFISLTVASFAARRTQTLIDDRQFIDSMIPHHSGAILGRQVLPAMGALRA